jgi:hypothetical protein
VFFWIRVPHVYQLQKNNKILPWFWIKVKYDFLGSLNKTCIWTILFSRYMLYSMNLKSYFFCLYSKSEGVNIYTASAYQRRSGFVPIPDTCPVPVLSWMKYSCIIDKNNIITKHIDFNSLMVDTFQYVKCWYILLSNHCS